MIPRSQQKELLDTVKPPLAELRKAMEHIKKTNRLFLNNFLIYCFVKKLVQNQPEVKILDIGTGIGDIPNYLAKQFRKDHQAIRAVWH